ncbi:hypothetical protein [Georgenia faecalis]|uniref:Uncharacterized protein n=1 Tax=Georgenia faecalis TaxID=2483799 RepID=A0ABV9DB39_9MICO|nr:hypothetical protein [Georgenia faecalis]
MRKKNRLVAIGAVGVTGLAIAGASLLPASAETESPEPTEEKGTTTEQESFGEEAATRIRSELDELVEDGTLTEDEADAVAETLAEALAEHGPGARGEESGGMRGGGMRGGDMRGGDMPQGGMPEGDMPEAGPDGTDDGFGPDGTDDGFGPGGADDGFGPDEKDRTEDDSTTAPDDDSTERPGRGGPEDDAQTETETGKA